MARRSDLLIFLIAVSLLSPEAFAYVEAPYSLGRIVHESTNIVVMRVEKVDKEQNLIIYTKVAGPQRHATPRRPSSTTSARPASIRASGRTSWPGPSPARPPSSSTTARASETCIDNYWYQAYPGGDWWNHVATPSRTSSAPSPASPKSSPTIVQQMLAGQEVVVTCMVDGDKNALQLRTAKIQRIKASLKIQDYDPKRDFAGWGGDEFRALAGMPGFTLYGGLTRVDQRANGIATADVDGDGKADLCIFGEDRVVLFRSAGKTARGSLPPLLRRRPLRLLRRLERRRQARPAARHAHRPEAPHQPPARARSIRDDSGMPSRRSATTTSPPPRSSTTTATASPTSSWPTASSACASTATAACHAPPPHAAPVLGKWHVIGPFDNADGGRLRHGLPARAASIDLKKTYNGKNNGSVAWKEGNFADGAGQLASRSSARAARQRRRLPLPRNRRRRRRPSSPSPSAPTTRSRSGSTARRSSPKTPARAAAPRPGAGHPQAQARQERPAAEDLQRQRRLRLLFRRQRRPPSRLPMLFDDVSDKASASASPASAATVKGDRLLVADFNGDSRPDFLYCAPTPLSLSTPQRLHRPKDSGLAFSRRANHPRPRRLQRRQAPRPLHPPPHGSKLFRNNGQARFTDVTAKAGDLAKPIPNALAATAADFNDSGKQDLLVACRNGPNRYSQEQRQRHLHRRLRIPRPLHQILQHPRPCSRPTSTRTASSTSPSTTKHPTPPLLIGNPARIK